VTIADVSTSEAPSWPHAVQPSHLPCPDVMSIKGVESRNLGELFCQDVTRPWVGLMHVAAHAIFAVSIIQHPATRAISYITPMILLLRPLLVAGAVLVPLIAAQADPQLTGTWTTKSRKVVTGPVRSIHASLRLAIARDEESIGDVCQRTQHGDEADRSRVSTIQSTRRCLNPP